MAYRRSVCARATLLTRRLNPCFGYLSHHNDRSKNSADHEALSRGRIDDFLSQRRCFGSYISNSRTTNSLFPNQRSIFTGNGYGVMNFHHRYMSTSIGNKTDSVDFISDVSGVIVDTPVEVVATQAAPVANEVAIAAADSLWPVAALQHLIDAVHSFTGLNWWASIALTTLLIRGITIPFLINQLKSTSKLSIMRPHIEEITKEVRDKGDDPDAIAEGRQKLQALFKENGVTPFTPLKGLLIQGPVFMSFFFAITNMAENLPSFKNGGALWFTDLTTPDATYILPVLTAVTFLITVECNMQEGLEGNPVGNVMKKFSRALAILFVPLTMNFSKAIFFYWITSNIFSFVYGAVLRLPGVKPALGIPTITMPPPSTSQQSSTSFFDVSKVAASQLKEQASLPATPDQAKSDKEKSALSSASSLETVSERLKALEDQVKQKTNDRQ
ncbi:mitochondrial inner membrane protein OXA1-like isoform X2 [Amaranthus tricolor]|uniref:mitochondrial inner membrane protein OXA1-like isoform X2 n=1 Tax=Amaranthus tricolor TaxID=29722 RepID=UPI002590EFDF|nr:mitochondrial inner membrane protein OXA1-like isoform X2 [Amaranthus tricolor]